MNTFINQTNHIDKVRKVKFNPDLLKNLSVTNHKGSKAMQIGVCCLWR